MNRINKILELATATPVSRGPSPNQGDQDNREISLYIDPQSKLISGNRVGGRPEVA